VIAFCLVNPRRKFAAKIEFLNKMLKAHHLEGKVTVTEKAAQNFRRDKWILFVLIPVIIYLIQLL
jgi:transposase-like protein